MDAPCPDQGMRVMLRAAVAASQGGAPEAVVYTMLEEAFVVFEDHITGQRMRLETLGQMVGALCACPSLVSVQCGNAAPVRAVAGMRQTHPLTPAGRTRTRGTRSGPRCCPMRASS